MGQEKHGQLGMSEVRSRKEGNFDRGKHSAVEKIGAESPAWTDSLEFRLVAANTRTSTRMGTGANGFKFAS